MTRENIETEASLEGGDDAEYQEIEEIDAEEEMRLIVEGRR